MPMQYSTTSNHDFPIDIFLSDYLLSKFISPDWPLPYSFKNILHNFATQTNLSLSPASPLSPAPAPGSREEKGEEES
jgi:hypothetical protein